MLYCYEITIASPSKCSLNGPHWETRDIWSPGSGSFWGKGYNSYEIPSACTLGVMMYAFQMFPGGPQIWGNERKFIGFRALGQGIHWVREHLKQEHFLRVTQCIYSRRTPNIMVRAPLLGRWGLPLDAPSFTRFVADHSIERVLLNGQRGDHRLAD